MPAFVELWQKLSLQYLRYGWLDSSLKHTSLCGALNTTYPHLLLSAGACSTALPAVHRYLVPNGRSAANSPRGPPLLLSIDGTDRRTDRRTTVA